MKIARKPKHIPKKIILLALGLVILAGAGAYGLYQSQRANKVHSSADSPIRQTNSVDYNPPTQDEQKQQEDTKTDVIKKNDQSAPPADSSITVTLSRANQGGKGLPLNIRTIITGATNGTCTAELTKTGQPTVKKTFPIIVQATYSTCQQADIAASEFSVDGDWALSVTASNSATTSKPATGSVTITK